MYKIEIQDEKIFFKDISRISQKEKENIFTKIDILKQTGLQLAQVKRLKHYTIADFRLRVGDYRILFNFFPKRNTITLIRILHRRKLY